MEYTFCIENKIKKGAEQKNQLFEEIEGLIKQYKEENENPKFGLIYITPEFDINSKKIFEDDTRSIVDAGIVCAHIHMIWSSKLADDIDRSKSIYYLISDILEKESKGLMEPIFDYTKHTIRAFLSFIESDFKSLKIEKETDGKWAKTVYRDWNEFEENLKNSDYVELAKTVHDIFTNEHGFTPHYSPSGISFSVPNRKIINGSRMFTNIAFLKGGLKIWFEKNPEMNFDEFEEYLKSKFTGIKINPPPPSYPRGFVIKLSSMEEFNKYIRPLIPFVQDYLLDKS